MICYKYIWEKNPFFDFCSEMNNKSCDLMESKDKYKVCAKVIWNVKRGSGSDAFTGRHIEKSLNLHKVRKESELQEEIYLNYVYHVS